MPFTSKIKKEHFLFSIFIIISFLVHFFTLENFPIFHFDEPWMAERAHSLLTIGKDITPSTNYAFDGYHGVYILMSYIQAISINFLGFTPLGIRLPSLIVFTASLGIWYYIFQFFFSKRVSFLTVLLLSLQLPVIWAAHYARAEMFVIFAFAIMAAIACKYHKQIHSNNGLLILFGFICTLSVSLHLVALYIPFVIGLLQFSYLCKKSSFNKRNIIRLALFVFGTFLALIFYYLIIDTQSLYFITLGNLAKANKSSGNLIDHFLAFPLRYISSLLTSKFNYLLIIAVVFSTIVTSSVIKYIRTKNHSKYKTFIFALLGYILIHLFLSIMGRSSNVYFVNIYPFQIFLFIATLQTFNKKINYFLLSSYFIVSISSIVIAKNFHKDVDVHSYISKLQENIEPKTVVLGNEFTMLGFKENNQFKGFYDIFYSNLFGNEITIKEYMNKFNIRYVILNQYAYQWRKSVLGQFQKTTNKTKAQYHQIFNFKWIESNCIIINDFKHDTYHSKFYERRRFPHYGVLWTLTDTKSPKSNTKVYDCINQY